MLTLYKLYPGRILHYCYAHGSLLLMCAIYAATVVSYLHYVPTWDGYLYCTAFLEHVHASSTWQQWLTGLALWNHSSYVYIGFLDIVYRLSGHGMWAVMAANAGLGVISIVCFYAILRRLTGTIGRQEAGLMTGVLACNPLFIACTITLNLDFPIAVFFLCALAALLYRHSYWLALAGTAMVFSKAPGALLYAMCGVAYLALYAAKRWWRQEPACHAATPEPAYNAATILLALVPLLLYAAYTVLNWRFFAQLQKSSSYLHTTFAYHHERVCVRLLNVFVLNFSWLAAAVCLAAAVGWLWGRTRATWRPWQRDVLRVLLCVFAGYLIFNLGITSQSAGLCPRYILPLTVLLFLFVCISLWYLCPWPRVRSAFAVLFAAILYWQSHRTIDPLSAWLYGTIPFGSHRVLRITSCTNNRYGVQDEYVYNTEHTVVGDLLDALYARLDLDAHTPLVLSYNHFLLGRIDPVTKRRTHALNNSFTPATYNYSRIARGEVPSDAVYVSMPWLSPLPLNTHGSATVLPLLAPNTSTYADMSLPPTT